MVYIPTDEDLMFSILTLLEKSKLEVSDIKVMKILLREEEM